MSTLFEQQKRHLSPLRCVDVSDKLSSLRGVLWRERSDKDEHELNSEGVAPSLTSSHLLKQLLQFNPPYLCTSPLDHDCLVRFFESGAIGPLSSSSKYQTANSIRLKNLNNAHHTSSRSPCWVWFSCWHWWLALVHSKITLGTFRPRRLPVPLDNHVSTEPRQSSSHV